MITDIAIVIFIVAMFVGIIGWVVAAGGACGRQSSVLDVLDRYSPVAEAEKILHQKGGH